MRYLAIATMGAALAVTPLSAQSDAEEPDMPAVTRDLTVTYSDLDLSKGRDRRKLWKRLDNAARISCGYVEQMTGTRIKDRDGLRCYRQAKTDARASYDHVLEQSGKGG